jgi:HK97 family phage major capsid protein/HK97 family phage prohead protease
VSETIQRAYSLLTVRSVNAEQRLISGLASTPEVDRMGDVVEPSGARFASELPLLLYHDTRLPVGRVRLAKTADGIGFEASFPEIPEPGTLRDRVAEAWQSVKAGLIKGVSIGFRTLEDGVEMMKGGGLKFTNFEIVELSLVSVPANASATISTIRSLDTAHLAATGNGDGSVKKPGVSGVSLSAPRGARAMTITEQIAAFEAKRAASSDRMNAIQTKAVDEGRGKDETEREEFDTLRKEVESCDVELRDLRALEQSNLKAAKPVQAATPVQASASRSDQPVITVKENRPIGIGFARAAMCMMRARLDNRYAPEVAKEYWPSDQELHAYLSVQKGAVPAGTTTQTVWASPLVYATNLASEFVEFLRPQTIVGRIPGLRRVPFNVRFNGQTSGGTGYWVGEGAPKPLTSFAFEANTLTYTKVAAISVITQELARFSTPSAEMLVRDALASALIERIDIDFIDPAHAATASSPASLTNGLTAQTSSGTSADNARTDIGKLLKIFLDANLNPASLVLVMPNSLAMALSLMVNSLGQQEFPGLTMNGGTLAGIPVVTSQYAANASGGGNLVIAINASEIFLADDGGVTIDASTEASLSMLDNPTTNSATATAVSVVSMYQTNSIALRAERFINWKKRRAAAVEYMDDVNWGSIGSPA